MTNLDAIDSRECGEFIDTKYVWIDQVWDVWSFILRFILRFATRIWFGPCGHLNPLKTFKGETNFRQFCLYFFLSFLLNKIINKSTRNQFCGTKNSRKRNADRRRNWAVWSVNTWRGMVMWSEKWEGCTRAPNNGDDEKKLNTWLVIQKHSKRGKDEKMRKSKNWMQQRKTRRCSSNHQESNKGQKKEWRQTQKQNKNKKQRKWWKWWKKTRWWKTSSFAFFFFSFFQGRWCLETWWSSAQIDDFEWCLLSSARGCRWHL
jgi:hypothetical protein